MDLLGRFLFVLALVWGTNAQLVCFEQKCRECPTINPNPGSERQCDPKSIMSTEWLDHPNQATPNSPTNNSTPNVNVNTMVEYACIKMTAIDPTVNGDNLDILKGCYTRSEARAFCRTLQDLQAGRGKTNYKCDVCEKDLCNGTTGQSVTLAAMLISLLALLKTLLR